LADLYLEKIDFTKYLSESCSEECGYFCCRDFIEALQKDNSTLYKCPFARRNEAYAFEAVSRIRELWPQVPVLTHPRPSYIGLVELNQPDEQSLVLVSGNNEFTQEVLLTVLGTTLCPFHVLFVDTDGNTIDMSMIYKTFTTGRISAALRTSGLAGKSQTKKMIVPGLAAALQKNISEEVGWHVMIGPKCAAELPLYLSSLWIPPNDFMSPR
jgi:CO dehydrogenase/acetyl-CoA synthase gamma subunit (corrinoid Fe-S protein)